MISNSSPTVRSSRRRRVLRAAVGSAAVTGAVLASAVTALADSTPEPAASAAVTASAAPTASASTTAPATAAPTETATGPATATSSATPSPSRSTPSNDRGGAGQGPVTPVRCVVTVKQNIGAGTMALMTISPSGPSVLFQGSGEDKLIPGLSLSRTHPKLPASAGIVAEILDPNSASPRLLTKTQGGGQPAAVAAFPKLPKGCSFTYRTSGSGSGQTTVVPKGGVAAGYEAPAGHGDTLLAVGGATAALGAAGVAFVALRRKAAATPTR
ncbi:hypothetical protein HUT11_15740 [Streptomyces seoulensis]|nr:hypothetical protein HUT11_15740 [Streptomyces seoulensis]